MILYKYVSMATAQKIVASETIQFTQPEYFNDPFDMPLYPDEPFDDALSLASARLRTLAKNAVWAGKSGILSLTRTPTNALMWAHYANRHEGVVIGIDMVAAGLTRQSSNLIPAQFGSVIYVSRREVEPFISMPEKGIEVGATHRFPADHYEMLQRVFLHKPLTWSYEEEVRVVKSLHGIEGDHAETPSGHFDVKNDGSRTIHLFSLPKEAICEVYTGIRADDEQGDKLILKARENNPRLLAYGCVLDSVAMTVGYHPHESFADIAASLKE